MSTDAYEVGQAYGYDAGGRGSELHVVICDGCEVGMQVMRAKDGIESKRGWGGGRYHSLLYEITNKETPFTRSLIINELDLLKR
jgi:hypothetical protein